LVQELQAESAACALTNPAASAKLNDARTNATEAWANLSLTPPDGSSAIQKLREAASKVADAVTLGFDPVRGQELMDEAAGIAQQLATEAIDAAIARGGNSSTILSAQTILMLGDTARLGGDFDQAIQDYRDALDRANQA